LFSKKTNWDPTYIPPVIMLACLSRTSGDIYRSVCHCNLFTLSIFVGWMVSNNCVSTGQTPFATL